MLPADLRMLPAGPPPLQLSDKTFTYSITRGAILDVSLTGGWCAGLALREPAARLQGWCCARTGPSAEWPHPRTWRGDGALGWPASLKTLSLTAPALCGAPPLQA